MTDQPDEYLTLEDVARRLKISTRTLRRYMSENRIEFFLLNPLSKRRHARFTEAHIQTFVLSHSQGLTTPERQKRTYNKRVVKHARKTKRKKVA